jgi:hypothetical protein
MLNMNETINYTKKDIINNTKNDIIKDTINNTINNTKNDIIKDTKNDIINNTKNDTINENETYQNKIINYIVDILRKTKLSDKTLGMFIRVNHFFCPFVIFFIVVFYCPYQHSYLIILFTFLQFFLYYYFDGCFLSMVEYKLDKIDNTPVDFLLEIFNIEANNKNRKKYISIFGIVNLFLIIFTFFVKYYFNIEENEENRKKYIPIFLITYNFIFIFIFFIKYYFTSYFN